MEHLTQPKDSNKTNNDNMLGLPELDLLPFEPISKQQMNRALIYFNALTKVENALANASSATQQAWQNTKRFNQKFEDFKKSSNTPTNRPKSPPRFDAI